MDELIYALEIIGAAAFAVSGAMAALEHEADIFGVIFLAVVTALGGGVIRDLLLGVTPPKMFVNAVVAPSFISTSTVAPPATPT